MVLTFGDLELLKQLRAAGGLGRNVRELNIRVTLRSPRERWLLAGSRDRSGTRSNIGSQSGAKTP